MPVADDQSLTQLLKDASRGDARAANEAMPLVYDRLRRIARQALRNERPEHTLDTTALAHEAYVRLTALDRIVWQSRAHFFAAAAGTMRRILVDYAVRRKAEKRGGGVRALDVDAASLPHRPDPLDEILAVHEALERLEAMAPRAVQVVECRVIMGMTIEETADALDLSPASIKRQWNAARAWLTRELSSRPDSDG